MKQLLLILSLLLSCTAAQAQRYRVVADSMFAYDEDTKTYDVQDVRLYRYLQGNELPCNKGLTDIPFDTMYAYSHTDINGGFVITALETRAYNSKGKPTTNAKYMVDWLFDQDGKPTKNTSFVPVDKDVFVYNDEGLLMEHHIFSNFGTQSTYAMKEVSNAIYHYMGDKCIRTQLFAYNDDKPLKLYSDTKYVHDVNGRRVYEDMRMAIGEDAEYKTFGKMVYNNNGDLLYAVSKIYTDTVLNPSTVIFSDTFSFTKRTYIEGGQIDSVWVAKVIRAADGNPKKIMVFDHEEKEYRTDSSVVRIGLGNVIPGYGPITVRTTSYLNASGYPITVIKEYLSPNGGVYILADKHTYTYEQY